MGFRQILDILNINVVNLLKKDNTYYVIQVDFPSMIDLHFFYIIIEFIQIVIFKIFKYTYLRHLIFKVLRLLIILKGLFTCIL